MIWPLAESLYVLAGGALAPLLVRAEPRAATHTACFDPAGALAIVTGAILLWPVPLTLTIEQGGTR